MKNYIFLTSEGTTYQPDPEGLGEDIENLQVIGFASGNSPEDAVKNLLKDDSHLKETTFDEIMAMELNSTDCTHHSLKDTK